MDDDKDDKSLIEKTIEVVKEIAHAASEAAKHALEPEPIKPGDEVVYLPATASSIMGDSVMPQYVVIPRGKTQKTVKKGGKKMAKKSAKKTANKPAKKSAAKKSAAKKWKSPAKAAKRVTKKKKTKKSKR
jgi:hypothetical protein